MTDRLDQDLLRRLSEYALPVALTVVTAFIAFYGSRPRLESSRPPSGSEYSLPTPKSPEPIVSGHARLWEDPLLAMLRVHQEIHGDEQHEQHDDDNLAVSDYFRQYVPGEGEPTTLVMPVLVSGGAYADDQETRRRTRYAVLNALATEGYTLTYPDRISMVHVWTWIVTGRNRPRRERIDVPVKLYEKDRDGEGRGAKSPRVLVLWINETLLGNDPLMTLAHIMNSFFGDGRDEIDFRGRMRLRIVGPSNSDMLLRIARSHQGSPSLVAGDDQENLEAWIDRYGREPYFDKFAGGGAVLVSPRATISMESLEGREQGRFVQDLVNNVHREGDPDSGLTFRAAIGDDKQLVDALAAELALRNAWPTRGDSRKVLLLVEHDTSYGLAVPELVKETLDDPDGQLHVERFLRGLDGRLPRDASGSRADGNAGGSGPVHANDNVEPPFGRSQLDYLQRLAERLKDAGNRSVCAVGVVGTDIYDKLLIIRALRREFPSAVFFSTDLDARMFSRRETPYTRNLVVASHYALRVDASTSEQRGQILSFRDSYQTATFVATRWALSGSSSDEIPRRPESFRPLMFEIGNYSAYQYTAQERGENLEGSQGELVYRHPESDGRRRPLRRLWPLVGVLLGVSLLPGARTLVWRDVVGRAIKPWRRAPGPVTGTLWLCRVLPLAALAMWVVILPQVWLAHRSSEGEPFSLWEGISVWPSVLLDALAITLAGVWLGGTQQELEDSVDRLRLSLLGRSCSARWAVVRRATRSRPWWRAIWPPFHSRRPLLIHRYWYRCQLPARITRILPTTLIVLATFACLYGLLIPLESENSCRGSWCALTDRVTSVGAVVLLLLLVIAVTDALDTCRRFARDLGSRGFGFHSDSRKAIQDLYGCGADVADELLAVRTIGDHTDVLLKSVRGPFWILLLIIFAHFPLVYENPSPSPTLSIILGASVVTLIGGVWGLRRYARLAREDSLRRLGEARSREPDRSDEFADMIAVIQNESRGAYRAWAQDPLLAGLLIPSGGVGAALLIKDLLPNS